MALRDLALFICIMGLLPVCAMRPYVGVLVWSWLGYLNPHRLTWGGAQDFNFAQYVAAATLLGFVLLVMRQGMPKIPKERETVLLILLWVMYTVTTFTAILPDEAWPEWETLSKILLMTFLTIILVDSEKRMHYLLLVIALSLGFYGFKGGLWGIVTGGGNRVWGPEGSFLADNNAIALALNMTLPILFYLGKIEQNWWLKRLLQATFLLSIPAVIFTYSRGGLLGLIVVLAFLFLRFGLITKVLLALSTVFIIPFLISQLPDQWLARMQTIKTYDEDGSAQRRLEAWVTAWNLAKDKPLTGGGFQVIDDDLIHRTYNPDAQHDWGQGVHSVYFEVLAENGFITFGIFMTLLIAAVLSLRRIRRESRRLGLERFAHYSSMLEVSFFAYAVSGAFQELAGFDLLYHLLALVVVLKVVFREALDQRAEQLRVEPRPAIPMPPSPRVGAPQSVSRRVRGSYRGQTSPPGAAWSN